MCLLISTVSFALQHIFGTINRKIQRKSVSMTHTHTRDTFTQACGFFSPLRFGSLVELVKKKWN